MFPLTFLAKPWEPNNRRNICNYKKIILKCTFSQQNDAPQFFVIQCCHIIKIKFSNLFSSWYLKSLNIYFCESFYSEIKSCFLFCTLFFFNLSKWKFTWALNPTSISFLLIQWKFPLLKLTWISEHFQFVNLIIIIKTCKILLDWWDS